MMNVIESDVWKCNEIDNGVKKEKVCLPLCSSTTKIKVAKK